MLTKTNLLNSIDTSKVTKGIKEHVSALTQMGVTTKGVTEQSRKAGDAIGGFFQRLDSGKLILAASTAVMAGYTKSAVDMVESLRVNAENITAIMGSQSGIMGFIGQGGQTSGTSRQKRSDLMALMAMTGWKDPAEMEKAVSDAEKIMHSAFGRGLKNFGVGNEEQLIDALSGNLDPTSKLGRALREKAPELFAQGALEREKLRVMAQPQFASIANTANGQAIITQEAQRNLAKRALTSISGQVEFDPASSTTKLEDFLEHLSQLTANIGSVVKPGSDAILGLATNVLKLLEKVPEIPVLITALLGVGLALSTLGVVLPLVTGGIEAMSVALLANPIGLTIAAIVALVVILGGLEMRFKVFSKAWEHFTQSEIGKDLISGLQSLMDSLGLLGSGDFMSGVGQAIEVITSAIAGVFDQVDRIYKLAKGGDILGAVKGGMELMIKLSPMGLAMGFLEAFKPSKKVMDETLVILKKMKDLWDGFVRWLNDIYDSIKSVVDGILALPGKLYEAIFGKKGTNESKTDKKEAVPGTTQGAAPGMPQPGQPVSKYLAEYWLGQGLTPQEIAERTTPGTDAGSVAARKNIVYAITTGNYGEVHGAGGDSSHKGDNLISVAAGTPYSTPETTPGTRENKIQVYINGGLTPGAAAAVVDLQERSGSSTMGHSGIDFIPVNAKGGEVTESGLAWVDEGEPIVPAEVARSSGLIDALRGIATGESSSGRGEGGITVNLGNITVNPGQGSDAYSIARDLKNAILREFESSEFEGQVERILHRKNRGYMA